MIQFADHITEIWLIGVGIYLLYEISSYFFFQHHLKKSSEPIHHKTWLIAFHEICSESSFSEEVDLFTSDVIGQPCVTGIRKPMILIPYHLLEALQPEDIKMIFHHEVTHIKKRDVFFKLFISLLNSLNWFNPLFYILKDNLSEWIEIACDEDVTFFMSIEQKKQYVNVLVKLNEQQWEQQQKQGVLCFNNQNLRNLKRRVWGIMKKNSLGNQFSKAVVFTLMVGVISGGSVIAKAADYPVNEIFSNRLDVLNPEECVLEKGSYVTDGIVFQKSPLDVGIYTEFVFENGESKEVIESQDISTRHQHQYETGTIKKHKKNKDGSCITTVYNGKICNECGKIVYGDIVNEFTSKKCPH